MVGKVLLVTTSLANSENKFNYNKGRYIFIFLEIMIKTSKVGPGAEVKRKKTKEINLIDFK
jgi:hypothetical protein